MPITFSGLIHAGSTDVQAGINIDSVFQKPGFPASKLPFVITLEPCSTSLVEEALKQINQLQFLVQPCVALPILD